MQKQLAIKILIIFAVGLLVLIPVSMVKYKIYERQGYLEQAKSSVAESWTGQQLLVSPVLVLPYFTASVSAPGYFNEKSQPVVARSRERQLSIILPDQLSNVIEVDNKLVFKGIYKIPVYDSSINLSGSFSAKKLQEKLSIIRAVPHFEGFGQPYLTLHVSDMRGVDQSPELLVNQSAVLLNPGSKLAALPAGLHGSLGSIDVLQKALDFSVRLSLRGMGSFSFVPLADDANTDLHSNWPHPEFIGASLPKKREVSSAGFSALWESSRYSSNGLDVMFSCIKTANCHDLIASSSGVRFIEPVDVYLQSERSIKYALLFIGLSFITFFIFEHIHSQRIHPIQYAFVGLAISVFYLLLISLAEHISFYWAYVIAVVCCSLLLLFYVRYMLRCLKFAVIFCAMLVGLYSLLYVIVQAEDFALLMGAILVFLVLAALMYVTRKIDWYELAEK